MSRYETYDVEDFVLDEGFQNWVKGTAPAAFWNHYIETHPAQREVIAKARKLLDKIYSASEADIEAHEIDTAVASLLTQLPTPQQPDVPVVPLRTGVWRLLMRIAVVAGLTGIVWRAAVALFPESGKTGNGRLLTEAPAMRVFTAEARETIYLSDSSAVTLEPGSTLKFRETFDGRKREVSLKGIGFFRVRPDMQRPFLVHSGRLVTRVVGTSFIVRAVTGETEETVEVREGKVAVFKAADFEKAASHGELRGILLTPNQKITLDTRQGLLTKSLSANPEIVDRQKVRPDWRYVNTPVSRVLDELGAAYQVEIHYDGELLSGCPLTITLADQPLKQKLDIICEAIEAQYEIIDGRVIIHGKSCL